MASAHHILRIYKYTAVFCQLEKEISLSFPLFLSTLSLSHPSTCKLNHFLSAPNTFLFANMDLFPSPPSSPVQQPQHDDPNDGKVICGSCDKVLSSDWFCADCHQRCATCNRFLSAGEHCTRCWCFDSIKNMYIRKPRHIHAAIAQPPPSPPNHYHPHALSSYRHYDHHHYHATHPFY